MSRACVSVCTALLAWVGGGSARERSAEANEGVGSVEQAVIGGDSTEPGEYAATGALVRGRTFRCTATLIAPDVAVTAAHCLSDDGFGDFGFTLDPDVTDEIDGLVPVSFYHRHPEFEERGQGDELTRMAKRNDVGVLILDRPVEGVTVEALEGNTDDLALAGDAVLTVVGYGRDEWAEAETAGVKRDGVVLVDQTTTWEMQSVGADQQPCKGDSGGPLFVEDGSGRRIAGVVSRALGSSSQCDSGAIYTRVQPYREWITEASADRDEGCSVGGGPGGLWGALFALLVVFRARRRG